MSMLILGFMVYLTGILFLIHLVYSGDVRLSKRGRPSSSVSKLRILHKLCNNDRTFTFPGVLLPLATGDLRPSSGDDCLSFGSGVKMLTFCELRRFLFLLEPSLETRSPLLCRFVVELKSNLFLTSVRYGLKTGHL